MSFPRKEKQSKKTIVNTVPEPKIAKPGARSLSRPSAVCDSGADFVARCQTALIASDTGEAWICFASTVRYDRDQHSAARDGHNTSQLTKDVDNPNITTNYCSNFRIRCGNASVTNCCVHTVCSTFISISTALCPSANSSSWSGSTKGSVNLAVQHRTNSQSSRCFPLAGTGGLAA